MPGICKKEDYFDSSMAVNVRQLIYNVIFQLLLSSTYIIEIVYLLNYKITPYFFTTSLMCSDALSFLMDGQCVYTSWPIMLHCAFMYHTLLFYSA